MKMALMRIRDMVFEPNKRKFFMEIFNQGLEICPQECLKNVLKQQFKVKLLVLNEVAGIE